MVNKRGFLLGEVTLKVIIAVLSLALLLYLLLSLYGIFQGEEDVKEAEATIDRIIEIANGLEEGSEGSFILLEPKGELSYSGEGKAECSGSCLCIDISRRLRDVDFCKRAEGAVLEGTIKIDDPVDITITKGVGGNYVISQR